MSEYNFISSFISTFQKQYQSKNAKKPKGKNQSTYADCEIIYNSTKIMIECKLLKDTHSNSSSFFSLLGEIIGLSTKESLFSGNHNNATGILIPEESSKTFFNLWKKNISVEAGNAFVESYKLHYLIMYSENGKKITLLRYDKTNNKWVNC